MTFHTFCQKAIYLKACFEESEEKTLFSHFLSLFCHFLSLSVKIRLV